MSLSGLKSSKSGGLQWQVPSFVAVGLFGLVVDSTVTYAAVRMFGLDPLIARFPAFSIATVLNFGLNRLLTFRHSDVALGRAFSRYLVVCAFGFGVNYLAYVVALQFLARMGISVPAEYLPLLVAWGAGCAMFVTFFGYRQFAFKA